MYQNFVYGIYIITAIMILHCTVSNIKNHFLILIMGIPTDNKYFKQTGTNFYLTMILGVCQDYFGK